MKCHRQCACRQPIENGYGYQMSKTEQPINLRIIIVIVIVGLFTGCASVFQDFDDNMSRKRFKKDFEALETAIDAYDKGDFETALGRFKEIKASSANERVSRRAWLGEICCCLMLADTPAAFTAAVGIWHDYTAATTDEDKIWSQALLDPLIVRQAPQPVPVPTVVEVPSPAVQPSANTQVPAVIQKQAVEPRDVQGPSQAEIEELQKKAKRADKLQLEMAKILSENRSLKEKIKALEAIDQNIQKKKTEMSTSGE